MSKEFIKFSLATWAQVSAIFLFFVWPVFWFTGGFGHKIKIDHEALWLGACCFALGTIGAAIAIAFHVIESRNRKDDDFKFSRTQKRYVDLNVSPTIAEIEAALHKLHYQDIKAKHSVDGGISVTAHKAGWLNSHPLTGEPKRVFIKNTKISISIDTVGKGQIAAWPSSMVVYGDYTHTRYYLLEELIDTLGWRGSSTAPPQKKI